MAKASKNRIKVNISVDAHVWKTSQEALRAAGIPISSFINLMLRQGFIDKPGSLKTGIVQLLELVPDEKLFAKEEVIEGVKAGVHETIQKRRAKVKRRS